MLVSEYRLELHGYCQLVHNFESNLNSRLSCPHWRSNCAKNSLSLVHLAFHLRLLFYLTASSDSVLGTSFRIQFGPEAMLRKQFIDPTVAGASSNANATFHSSF